MIWLNAHVNCCKNVNLTNIYLILLVTNTNRSCSKPQTQIFYDFMIDLLTVKTRYN